VNTDLDQLIEIVARVFDIPAEQVTDSLSREELEVWTSLNHLLLISEIETEMGVQFTSDEVLNIVTFGDIRRVVSKKK
jgi:acyl carrier protein